jgi:multidrug efflux pump subunit AcrB
MRFTKFAIKRPVTVLCAVLCLFVFGLASVFSMDIESTPEMNRPVFMIRTQYENVGPEEIDELVTQPIEAALASVSDYTSMTSRTSQGSTMTVLQFDYSVDLDKKYDEIKNALENISRRLPDDCGDPSIMQMMMDQSSIMNLSIKSSGDENLLAYVEDTVATELENISGVSSVSVSGGRRQYIQIQVREEEMTQYGLTLSSIASAISSVDFTTTVGTLNRGEVVRFWARPITTAWTRSKPSSSHCRAAISSI